MFSWVSKDARRKKEPELFQTVSEGLRQLYAQKLLPLEEHYRFHEFHSPALEDADFDNKPMVLLVGQYSTGKTTFIRHLIEQDFQGMRLGPSPPPTLSSRSCTAPPRAWCRATRSSSTRGGPSASSTPSATPSSTGSRSSIRGGGKGPPGSRPSSDYCPRETPQRPLPGTWSPATFQRKPLPRGLRVGVAGSRGSVSPPPPLLPEFPRLSD